VAGMSMCRAMQFCPLMSKLALRWGLFRINIAAQHWV
jgi:hypothetical protein